MQAFLQCCVCSDLLDVLSGRLPGLPYGTPNAWQLRLVTQNTPETIQTGRPLTMVMLNAKRSSELRIARVSHALTLNDMSTSASRCCSPVLAVGSDPPFNDPFKTIRASLISTNKSNCCPDAYIYARVSVHLLYGVRWDVCNGQP